jgi:hypothetical protein
VTCYNYEVFTNYMKEFVLIILKVSIFHVISHWRTTIREQNLSLFQLILIQIAIVFCRDDLENGKLENIRLDAKWKYRDRIATIRFLIVHRVLSVTTIAMSTFWLWFIDQNLTFLTKLIKKNRTESNRLETWFWRKRFILNRRNKYSFFFMTYRFLVNRQSKYRRSKKINANDLHINSDDN